MTTPYKINGTALTLEPTTGRWNERREIGVDGNGRHLYAPLRSYEMKWEIIDLASFNQLIGFFNSIGATGSVIVDLPCWNSATGGFNSYTGCYITEPTAGEYFEDWPLSTTVLVTNIRTP